MIFFNLKIMKDEVLNGSVNISYLAFLVEIGSFQKKYDSCIKLLFYVKNWLRVISILWGNFVTKEICFRSLFAINKSRHSVAE